MMTESEFDFCLVRDKYAKPYEDKSNAPRFELYSTSAEPGLLSIYYNEDLKSFRNWALEVGPATKTNPNRGRIRDLVDNQINEHVLEMAGNHDGSVYMACPPDPNSTMDVRMPYITVLMRDIHGYASVEFTVLDTLGFSRKIHAKTFRSRCIIGELNCEIPMRLSPTWNYACINLDETLMDAFGTHLACVQRVKVNANCRVRRVYFSNQILPYNALPKEFHIKLSLSPHEKEETEMFEQFRFSEPTGEDRHPPWALPKLASLPSERNHWSVRANDMHHRGLLRKNVEIVELPQEENEPDKYKSVETKNVNADKLRHMLHESFPQSKILLPTLSLIYPENKAPIQAETVHPGRMDTLEAEEERRNTVNSRDGEGIKKLRKCFEAYTTAPKLGSKTDAGNSFDVLTDWDLINYVGDNENENDDLPDTQPHHHILGCKYKTSDLVRYIKHRHVLGEYDLFSGTVKNVDFFNGLEEDEEDWEEEYGMEGGSDESLANEVKADDVLGYGETTVIRSSRKLGKASSMVVGQNSSLSQVKEDDEDSDDEDEGVTGYPSSKTVA